MFKRFNDTKDDFEKDILDRILWDYKKTLPLFNEFRRTSKFPLA